MLIKTGGHDPFAPAGTRLQLPVQLTDIFPLVVSHAGLTANNSTRPLKETIAPVRSWAFPAPAKVRTSPRYLRELESIERDHWKLIVSTRGTVGLFDLRNDPDELVNLAMERADIVDELRSIPAPPVYRLENLPALDQLSAAMLDRLRALGYLR